MIQLFLHTAWRHLVKNKFYTLVKLVGLMLGFAVFGLILLYYNHETTYESWNENADRLFRLELSYKGDDGKMERSITTTSDMALKMQEDIPEIENVVRFCVFEMGERLLTTTDKKSTYIDHILSSDSVFFNAFRHRFIYGDPSVALSKPESMVLTRETAERLFGERNPLGQKVFVSGKFEYVVSGVVDTKGVTSHFKFDALRNMQAKHDEWNNFNYYSYVLLKNGADKNEVERKARKSLLNVEAFKKVMGSPDMLGSFGVNFYPVQKIHLYSHEDNELDLNGNSVMVTILLTLSVLILIISFVNFTNLSVVQTIKRAKEIALKEVNGATKAHIKRQFFFEQLLLVIMSAFLGILFIELLLPWFNGLFNLQLSLTGNLPALRFVLTVLVLTIFVFAVISGVYPVSLILNYPAALILKGSFSDSSKGTWLRKGLLVTQFAISSVFIISLWIVALQVHHLKSKDVGFDSKQVLVVKIHNREAMSNFRALKDRIRQLDQVKGVSLCNYEPGISGTQVQGRTHKGNQITLAMINVDFDYFRVLGMRLKEGRFFDEKYKGDSTAIILNETAVKEYGLKNPLNEILFDEYPVVGIVKDFNQKKADVPVASTGFVVNSGGGRKDKMLIKYEGNSPDKLIGEIGTVLKEFEPEFPMRFTFLDQEYAKLYRDHERLEQLFMLFTLVIIAITAVGLFAIVAYMIQLRTREMAIRKVLGASGGQLIRLLQSDFIKLTLLGNGIAIPLAYFFASYWLNGFAYRISVPWVPFLCTIALSVLLTAIITRMQSLMISRSSPMETLGSI